MSLPLVPFPGIAASPIPTEEESEFSVAYNKRFKATIVNKPDSYHFGMIVEFDRTTVRAPWLANAGYTFEYQKGPWCFRPGAAPMGQNPPAMYNMDPVSQLQAAIFQMKLGEDCRGPNFIAKKTPGETDEWACTIDNLFGRIFEVESGWKTRGLACNAVCLIALAFIEQQAIMKENEERDPQDPNFIAHAFSHADQAAEFSVSYGKRAIRKCDIYCGIIPELLVQDMNPYVGQDSRNDLAPTTSFRKRKAGGQGTIEWNLPTREDFDREIRDSARLLRMARNLKAGLDSIIQKSLGQDGKSTKLKMMRQFRAMLDGGTTPENWASFLEGISNARIIERAFPTPLVTASKPAVSDPPPPNTPLSSHSAILPRVNSNASLQPSTTANPGQILPNALSFTLSTPEKQPGFYFNGQFIPIRGDDNVCRVVGTLFQGLFAAKSNAEFQSALKAFFSEFLKPVAKQDHLSIDTANNFALNCMQTFLEAYDSIVPGGEEGVWVEIWQRMRRKVGLAAAAMGLPAQGDSAIHQNAYIPGQENQRATRTHGLTGEQEGSFRTIFEEVVAADIMESMETGPAILLPTSVTPSDQGPANQVGPSENAAPNIAFFFTAGSTSSGNSTNNIRPADHVPPDRIYRQARRSRFSNTPHPIPEQSSTNASSFDNAPLFSNASSSFTASYASDASSGSAARLRTSRAPTASQPAPSQPAASTTMQGGGNISGPSPGTSAGLGRHRITPGHARRGGAALHSSNLHGSRQDATDISFPSSRRHAPPPRAPTPKPLSPPPAQHRSLDRSDRDNSHVNTERR